MNRMAVAQELVKVAKDLTAIYIVRDEEAQQVIKDALGDEGYHRWNELATDLVNLYFKGHGKFDHNILANIHQLGALMTNYKKGEADQVWKQAVKTADQLHDAAIRAMSLFDLELINKQGYADLEEQIMEAKHMISDLQHREG